MATFEPADHWRHLRHHVIIIITDNSFLFNEMIMNDEVMRWFNERDDYDKFIISCKYLSKYQGYAARGHDAIDMHRRPCS